MLILRDKLLKGFELQDGPKAGAATYTAGQFLIEMWGTY